WTFPWKRSTRSSATWRNPFHATRPQDAKSSGLLAQPAKKSIATMMKLWTGRLGSEDERRIIDLSHLRRFSSSSAGEIDNAGTAESLVCRIRENHVGCLFRDHVNRCDDEKSRNPWEDRGVNDPQPLGPIDSEITVEHCHRILPSADLASAGCVVAPGIVFRELGQAPSLIGIGRLLFIEDIRDLRVNRADKFDSIDDGVDVLLPVAGSFVKVAEIDFGRIARID